MLVGDVAEEKLCPDNPATYTVEVALQCKWFQKAVSVLKELHSHFPLELLKGLFAPLKCLKEI